eukprot:5440399-Pyramimonas_sp.AAC.2
MKPDNTRGRHGEQHALAQKPRMRTRAPASRGNPAVGASEARNAWLHRESELQSKLTAIMHDMGARALDTHAEALQAGLAIESGGEWSEDDRRGKDATVPLGSRSSFLPVSTVPCGVRQASVQTAYIQSLRSCGLACTCPQTLTAAE